MGGQWKTLVMSTGDTQDIAYGKFYDDDSDSVSFKVKWMDIAWVKVMKADAKSKVNLAGAVFGIYSDKGCTKLVTKMPETDAGGASSVELIKTQDTVYVKEITAPSGYKFNTAAYNVDLQVGKTQTVTVTNEEQKGKIVIRKKGKP